MLTISDYSNATIATACWRAARGELHSVMLSVCMVFKNRADAGWFDHDLYQNCVQWLVENPGDFPDTRDPEFRQMLVRLDSVTSGLVPDRTGGAMYFCPKSQLPEKIEGQITTTIGGVVFIR